MSLNLDVFNCLYTSLIWVINCCWKLQKVIIWSVYIVCEKSMNSSGRILSNVRIAFYTIIDIYNRYIASINRTHVILVFLHRSGFLITQLRFISKPLQMHTRQLSWRSRQVLLSSKMQSPFSEGSDRCSARFFVHENTFKSYVRRLLLKNVTEQRDITQVKISDDQIRSDPMR